MAGNQNKAPGAYSNARAEIKQAQAAINPAPSAPATKSPGAYANARAEIKQAQTAIDQAKSAGTWKGLEFEYSPNVKTYGNHQSQEFADYLNSRNSNYTRTGQYLQQANKYLDYHKKYGNTDNVNYWTDMVNALNGRLLYDYSNAYQSYTYTLNGIDNQLDTAKQNLKNSIRGIASLSPSEMAEALFTIRKSNNDIKQLQTQREDAVSKQSFFRDKIFEAAPQEVKDALARLQSGESHVFKFTTINPADKTKPGQAVTQGSVDKQLVDDYMRSFGMNTMQFNTGDSISEAVASAGQGIGGGLAGSLPALYEFDRALTRLEYDRINGKGSYDAFVASEAEKRKEKVLFAAENPEGAQAQYNSYKNQLDGIKRTLATLDTTALTDGVSITDVNIRRRELKAQQVKLEAEMKLYEGIMKDAEEYNRQNKPDAFDFGPKNETMEALKQKAMEYTALSQESLREATEGKGYLGKLALEGVKTGVEMGFDIGVGLVMSGSTGGASLAPMFVRVLGNEYATALMNGAEGLKAAEYAAVKALIEVGTEKVFGTYDFFRGGKGIASGWSETLIQQLAKSPEGRTILRAILASGEEGVEEMLADIAGPLADKIYKDATWSELWKENTANIWHDYLLGSLMGGLGAIAGTATGQNAQANMALYRGELNADAEAQEQIIQEGIDAIPERTEAKLGDKLQNRQQGPVRSVTDVINAGGIENLARQDATTEATEEIAAETEEKLKKQERHEAPVTTALRKLHNGEPLTRTEASMLHAAGLIDSDTRKLLTKAGKQYQRINKTNAENGDRRVPIISNAFVEGVGQNVAQEAPLESESRHVNDEFAYENEDLFREDEAEPVLTDEQIRERTQTLPPPRDLGPDTVETKQKAEADLKQRIGDKDSLEVESHSLRTISEIWDRQAQRLAEGKRMSRDAEFERYYDSNGKQLTLEEAAKAEKNGEKVTRTRVISKNTLNEMDNATESDPLVYIRDYYNKQDKTHSYTGFLWDGTHLRIIHAFNDPHDGGFRIDDDNTLHAGMYERAAVYLTEVAESPDTSFAYKKHKGGDYLTKKLFEHYIPSESATEAAQGHGQSGDTDIAPTFAKKVKPSNAGATEDSIVAGVNLDERTEAEKVSTVEQTNDTIEGHERSDQNEQESPLHTNEGNKGEPSRDREKVAVFEQGRRGGNEYVTQRYASRAPRFIGARAEELSHIWEEAANIIEDQEFGVVLSPEEVEEQASKAQIAFKNAIENYFGIPITFYEGGADAGFVIRGGTEAGLFINLDDWSATSALNIFHELTHHQWEKYGIKQTWDYDRPDGVPFLHEEKISRRETVLQAFKNAKADAKEIKTLLFDVLRDWGESYLATESGLTPQEWFELTDLERLKYLNHSKNKTDTVERFYEEVGNILVVSEAVRLYPSLLKAVDTYRSLLVEKGIYTQAEMDFVLGEMRAFNYAEILSEEDANQEQEDQTNYIQGEQAEPEAESEAEQPKEQRAGPPGARVEHQRGLENKTQVRGSEEEHKARMKDLSEKYGIDDGTFLSLKREDVSRVANYWIEKYGMQEEWNRLMAEKNWSRVDFSEAGKIVYEMTMQLNRDMAAEGNKGLGPVLEKKPGESYEEYRERQKQSDKDAYLARREPIDALLQMYAQQKSEAGQKLQEQHKFTVADEIRMRASQRFLSYSEDGEIRNASDAAKNAKMWNIVDDLLTRAEKADSSGDVQAMADLSRMVARIRGRERLLGRMGVSGEHRMLNDLIKHGFDTDAIADLMYGGINKIMDDLTPMTYADIIQTVRMTNMLSNIATGINNFKNNAVALRLGAIAQNAAYPFAKVFENITGKKVAFTDSSFLRVGNGKGRAEIAAMEYALLSSYYGLNFENGRFDPNSTSGTDFYLHGAGMSGVVGRALARYNFLVNAFVLNPDAPAKARANLAMKQGIEKAFEGEEMTPEMARNKKELEAYADVETKRRVLQDDNGVTNAVMWAKNQLNKAQTPGGELKIGGRRLGNLKLGDFAMAFARVPANVGYQKAMATPFGATYQMLRYAYGLAEAKAHPETMETIKMAKLSRDIGRAATTWGMVALGAMGAMCGALKNFDDTDDDEEKKLAAEKGYKGLTFNVSALLRGGGEWQNDDIVVSGNFLEILAMPLSIGAIMYDAKQENENMGFLENAWYGTKESFGQMVDAVMDIPGLQQAAQLYESFANQSPNDKAFNRAVKAIGQFAANSSTSYFMPNLVSQVTAGVDNKQRDVYKTDSYGESLLNIIKSKIPGLRQTIPEKTDSLGNTRTYGDTQAMSIINTVLLPGDIKRYHISELEKEMLRLKKETGYSGTIFDTSAPKKIEVGENAYALNADQQRAYHETAAKYLVQAYDAFRTSEEYKHLSDSQRLDVIKNLRLDIGRRIKNEALELAGVEDRMTMDKWETELKTTEDKIAYLSAKAKQDQLYYRGENNALLPRDYRLIDRFVQEEYPKLTDQQKELLDGSYPDYDKLYDGWKSANITAEDYYKIRAAVKKWDNVAKDKTNEETYTRAQRNLMVDLEQMFKNEPNKLGWAIEENRIWQTIPASSSTIENLRAKTGLSYEKIDAFRDLLESQPVWEGYKNMPDNQVYSIIHDSKMPDREKWLFFEAVASDSAIKNVRKAQAENSDKSFDAAIENAVGWEPTKFSRYKPYSYLENKKAG